ncbi:MAG: hypothetical protein AAFO15_00690 [Pseudomonadota bacterium]
MQVVLLVLIYLIANIQSITNNQHHFSIKSKLKQYYPIKEYIEKSLKKYNKFINSDKIEFMENKINNILNQNIPLLNSSIILKYKYQNKHVFSSKYIYTKKYIPLLQKSNIANQIQTKYKWHINSKIQLKLLSYKQNFYTINETKQLIKFIKKNQSHDLKNKSKPNRQNNPNNNISSQYYQLQTGVQIFQPIKYKYYIKIPLQSYHKFNLIYFSQDDLFAARISNTLQLNINQYCDFKIKHTIMNQMDAKYKYKYKYKYNTITMSLAIQLPYLKFKISYGLINNKYTTPLLAHILNFNITLQNN